MGFFLLIILGFGMRKHWSMGLLLDTTKDRYVRFLLFLFNAKAALRIRESRFFILSAARA